MADLAIATEKLAMLPYTRLNFLAIWNKKVGATLDKNKETR